MSSNTEVTTTDRLLTPREVAEVLGVGRDFVYSLIGKGDLPSIKVNRMRRVWFSELRSWVNAQGAVAA